MANNQKSDPFEDHKGKYRCSKKGIFWGKIIWGKEDREPHGNRVNLGGASNSPLPFPSLPISRSF